MNNINNKTRIGTFLPYFGTLPNYFSLWLKSAEINRDIMFIIITDQELDVNIIPENVYVINMTFHHLKKVIQKNFDFPINLDEPYKLCDFRPAYGDIFSYYIKKFQLDYWGFCDPDVIWGNIKEQLNRYDAFSGKYDKIGVLGHLQFFKNNKKNKMLYKKAIASKRFTNYQYIFSSRFSFNFDEQFGINEIAKNEGLNILDFSNLRSPYVDVWPNEFWFKDVTESSRQDFQYFYWSHSDGLKQFYVDKNKNTTERSISYVHFQKRSMDLGDNVFEKNDFFIIPNKFISSDDFKHIKVKKNKLYMDYKKYLFKRFFRKGNFSIASIKHKIEFKKMLKDFFEE